MSSIRTFLSLVAVCSGLANGMLWAQGFSPEEAVQRMQVPPGFQVKLAACEPEVRQPVTMSFDDRGRLWVIQYLQYPTPAGLKPVKVDQYLRTVYDRVPEPPPTGPQGADKITIFEDTHGDGRFRKVKDFVTGLNLASGMALGSWRRLCGPAALPALLPRPQRRRYSGRRSGSAAERASAWRMRTPFPIRCSGGRTAGSTGPRGAR